jgi:hypothetical protein
MTLKQAIKQWLESDAADAMDRNQIIRMKYFVNDFPHRNVFIGNLSEEHVDCFYGHCDKKQISINHKTIINSQKQTFTDIFGNTKLTNIKMLCRGNHLPFNEII